MTHDLVIRRATLVDGTGAEAREGVDIAVDGDRIVEVGPAIGGTLNDRPIFKSFQVTCPTQ